MTALRIRPAVPADLRRLNAIETERFATDRLSPRSLKSLLARPTAAVLAAERGGRVDGFAVLLLHRTSTAGRLYSLAVAAEAARRGVAGALLAACEEEARRRGCRTVRLEVRADNAPARALYAAAGYRATAELPAYYEDGAAGIRMEKPLNEAATACAPAPATGEATAEGVRAGNV